MLTKWILLGLIGATRVGWFLDRSVLMNELYTKIKNRPLTERNRLKDIQSAVRSSFFFPEVGGDSVESSLLQKCSGYQITYKIVGSWRLWKETKDRRYVTFASTALGILECSTAQEFRGQHLVVSKHVRVEFEVEEVGSLDRFIQLALNDGN